MAQVTVEIAGKAYRMACADGEEAHLTGLAAGLDARVGEMRDAFGAIGDMRLQVMAALSILDEGGEARRRLTALEDEVAALRAALERHDAHATAREEALGQALAGAAARIERVARALATEEG